jgi:GDP-mannose transporter
LRCCCPLTQERGLTSFASTRYSSLHSYSHLIDGNLNILLVVFQAAVAVLCLQVCKLLKLVDLPPLNQKMAMAWSPVNLFFCLMLFTGMASLQTNSVPMVTVFKNITNIFTALGDFYFFQNKPELLVIAAFAVMLLGAMAAASQDAFITWTGFFWMMLNCLSTSGYVLYLKFATKHISLSTLGMVYVNNVLCIVFLLPVATLLGQVSLFTSTTALHTTGYMVKNAFAGLVGFFLNVASLQCVAATGPTTYAIIGSVNKAPVAILGYLLFANVISGQTWFFIGVSMFGGWLFSYAKLRAAPKKTTL